MTAPELLTLRKAIGLTRQQLANETGKGYSTITRYELGTDKIPKVFEMAVRALARGEVG